MFNVQFNRAVSTKCSRVDDCSRISRSYALKNLSKNSESIS